MFHVKLYIYRYSIKIMYFIIDNFPEQYLLLSTLRIEFFLFKYLYGFI